MKKFFKKIKNHLSKTKTTISKTKKRPWLWIVVPVFLISSFVLFFFLKDLPSPTTLKKPSYPVATKIFDRNGNLLYEIYSEQKRTPIKLEAIPDHVKNASIAIEDKNFYQHSGLAIKGIIRASFKTIFKKELQGGSTITQQLVKNALLTPERTLKRKIKEAVLAFFTEILYSKDQILEMYFNFVPYGGTAYGIEEAAQTYFNKSAQDVDLAEAAMLAGLPAAPTRFSPFGPNPELAKQRQKLVLKNMVEEGYITEEEKTVAEEQELTFSKQAKDIQAPHFVMYVKNLLVQKYGQRMVEQGGLRVTTSLDLEIQEFTQDTVATEVGKLENMEVSNGAAIVTKPPTGEILAMVGSKDYFAKDIDGNVNLTTSLRQPGSSIKPVNYATGLIKGFTPATLFLDIPTCFSIPNQPLYCPKNYDGSFHGPTQMRFALGNSYNIPAVKMLAMNGVDAMIATGSAMGITTWNNPERYGLSLTLGGAEVKMTDMAVAFGVFANQGKKVTLNPILKVESYQGEVFEEHDFKNHPPTGEKVIPAEVAYLTSHMLLDNNARTAAFGPNSQLVVPGHAVSVKTGTTDDLRDNWTIGYNPNYLAATWVGNNDNSPMHPYLVSGITGAAPIWNTIMSQVLEDQPDEWPKKPENVVGRHVCTYQNQGENNNTECNGRFEYFIKGTEENMLHGKLTKQEIWIDKETNRPPEPGQTENLELREHLVASDYFVKDYCVTCPHEEEKPVIINYPYQPESLPKPYVPRKND
jgi:1A family penicillin-binding protein